jgi:hypothetical protein
VSLVGFRAQNHQQQVMARGLLENTQGRRGGPVSIKTPPQTERQFERAVVELAELQGWLVYHTYDSRRSNPGFPDLVMVRNGALLFVELKSEKGRTSSAQEQWISALDEVAGWPTDAVEVYIWRPSMWGEIEEILR